MRVRDLVRAISAAAILILAACGSDLATADRLARSQDPRHLEEAERLYQKEIDRLVRIHQDRLLLRLKLGRLLMRRELFGPAKEHLQFAMEQKPADAEIRLDYAICLANLARAERVTYDEAEAAYRAVLELEPSNARASYGLAMIALTARKDGKAGRKLCAEALAKDPEFGDAHILMARLLVDDGELAQAATHYAKALERESLKSHRWRDLARSYATVLRSLGRSDEAKALEAKAGS